MRLDDATSKANVLATSTGQEHYVVLDSDFEPESYETASDHDLETFYAGIPDRNIIYSTLEGFYD